MSIPAGMEPRWSPADGEYLDGPVGEVPPDWRHPAGLDRYEDTWSLDAVRRTEQAIHGGHESTRLMRLAQSQNAAELLAEAACTFYDTDQTVEFLSPEWHDAMGRFRDQVARWAR